MATIRELSDGITAAVRAVSGAVVTVRARRRPSSGIVWSDELVVTASHAIHREESITVALSDGTERTAALVGRDPATDIALLRVAGGGLTPLAWHTGDVEVGALVFPTGRPAALRVAMGVVAERGGAWQTASGGLIDGWIDVDATLPHGFSGGPLVDADGKGLGMNTSALTPRGAVVPYATVARVVARLEQHGTAAPGYLGAGFYPGTLPDEVAALAGQVEALMTVTLEPDGPSRRAGLLVGDALVRVDGQPVVGLRQLLGLLAAKGAGATVRLTVIRAGALTDVEVTLGTRPHRQRC